MVFKVTLKVKMPEKTLKRLEKYRELRKKIMDSGITEFGRATNEARAEAPVKTGKTRDETRMSEIDPTDLRLRIGCYAKNEAGVYYPVFLEFGTKKMHARPFFRAPMWEAFYRWRETVWKLIKGEI